MENKFETMFSGFWLDDPTLVDRDPKVPDQRTRRLPWGSIAIIESLDTKGMSRGQTIGASSPYLDEMMMANVKQFQMLMFANAKRFQTKHHEKLWIQVSNTMGSSERWLWGYG